MENNKPIELREYESLSYDEKNVLLVEEDQVLQEELENKKILFGVYLNCFCHL